MTATAQAQPLTPLLVTVKQAADLLSISVAAVYEIAATGQVEKRYVGKGTRSFRLTYESVKRYAENLPTDPVA